MEDIALSLSNMPIARSKLLDIVYKDVLVLNTGYQRLPHVQLFGNLIWH